MQFLPLCLLKYNNYNSFFLYLFLFNVSSSLYIKNEHKFDHTEDRYHRRKRLHQIKNNIWITVINDYILLSSQSGMLQNSLNFAIFNKDDKSKLNIKIFVVKDNY